MGVKESKNFRYLGVDIVDGGDNQITMEQSEYIKERVKAPIILKERLEKV